jgi:hypothetical protein
MTDADAENAHVIHERTRLSTRRHTPSEKPVGVRTGKPSNTGGKPQPA